MGTAAWSSITGSRGPVVAKSRLRCLDPHFALAVGAACVLATEYARLATAYDGLLVAEASLAFLALLIAWRTQERLRLGPLLALAFLFHTAWVGLRLGLSVGGDTDIAVYGTQGHALLSGEYPRSEYPVGAVLLFGFETWLGGGAARTANALLMIPFQCATVALVWATRTRLSPWLAALVAFSVANAFWWELRFDLVPTALLAAGLVLALRREWGWAGVALGLGTAVKWTPSLAFAVLAVWLVASREGRAARRLAIGFAAVLALVSVPFLLWSPDNVLAAYTLQGGRGITGESIWYLPLRALRLSAPSSPSIWGSIGAPGWSNMLAGAVQVYLVGAMVIVAAVMRPRLQGAVAFAALAPVVFFLTNRIFSPQFLVLILVSCAIASALVLHDELEQLVVGLMLTAALGANLLVYQLLPESELSLDLLSSVLFVLALSVCAFLLRRASEFKRAPPSQKSFSSCVVPSGSRARIWRTSPAQAASILEERPQPVGR